MPSLALMMSDPIDAGECRAFVEATFSFEPFAKKKFFEVKMNGHRPRDPTDETLEQG